jgi:predicted metal-dependent phosphoesterase TrpH
MKSADLHIHTYFSDSTFSPEEAVVAARKEDVSCISIVDHDTVSGIEPTLAAGVKEGVEVIPGIELSSEYQGIEVHILGYLIDFHNERLLSRLKQLSEVRVARIYEIVDKLKSLGVPLEADSVFSLSTQGTVGRLHVAEALVKSGAVANIREAFTKYIGEGCPGYVLGFRVSPQEAVQLILGAGGIPILAHPYMLHSEQIIMDMIGFGIKGLEVYYPEHTAKMVEKFEGFVQKYHLLATGGSDCHGSIKPHISVGSTRIPYGLVELLKEAQRENG